MRRKRTSLEFSILELDGVRYAVLREAALLAVLRAAGHRPAARASGPAPEIAPDGAALAARLRRRRQGVGLSQVGLARLAGVRVETLNRIERGHATPDFSTIRKLAQAMQQFELKHAGKSSD